jgi:hypothetical protein
MENPYTPPTEPSSSAALDRNSLHYIWLWLAVALVGSMVSTPADLFSIVLALVYGALSFLIGVALTHGNVPARVTQVLVLSAACAAIATQIWLHAFAQIWLSPYAFTIGSACLYTCASIICGIFASRSLVKNRRRILFALMGSYLAGIPLGPLGCALVPIPCVLLANRQPRRQTG